MVTSYIDDFEVTSSWTRTGRSSTLTESIYGGKWFSNAGSTVPVIAQIKASGIPSGKKFVLEHPQIRRLSADAGQLDKVSLNVWNASGAQKIWWSLQHVYLPVNEWVRLPNLYNDTTSTIISGGSGRIEVQVFGLANQKVDHELRAFRVFNAGDEDDLEVLLDSNDTQISQTPNNASNTAAFTYLPPNEMVDTLLWDWGDGSDDLYGWADLSSTRNPTHTFPTAGTYNITLRAANSDYLNVIHDSYTATIPVTVPTGNFTAAFSYNSSFLDVDVDASESIIDNESTVPVTYTWDWGDGTTTVVTGEKVTSHSYSGGGAWTITLTISNALGQTNSHSENVPTSDISTSAINFTVAIDLLSASFTPTETTGTFSWNFGDGTTSTIRNPIHNYALTGSYAVTLTWTPTTGPVATQTKTITVAAAYTPIEKYTDALRLEIELPPDNPAEYNFIENPNGELGGFGWLTPTLTGSIRGSNTDTAPDDKAVPDWKLIFKNTDTVASAQHFQSELVRIDPNEWVNAAWQSPYVDGYYKQSFIFYKADMTVISESSTSPYLQSSGSQKRGTPIQAPALSNWVSLKFAHYSTTAGAFPAVGAVLQMRRVMMSIATTSAAIANLYYTEGNNWLDILDDSFEMTIVRSELDVGIMQAMIRNGELDPSLYPHIRPGRKIRLRAATKTDTGSTAWENIYSGETNNAQVNYERFEIQEIPGVMAEPEQVLNVNYIKWPEANNTRLVANSGYTSSTVTYGSPVKSKTRLTVNATPPTGSGGAFTNGNDSVVEGETYYLMAAVVGASRATDWRVGAQWKDSTGTIIGTTVYGPTVSVPAQADQLTWLTTAIITAPPLAVTANFVVHQTSASRLSCVIGDTFDMNFFMFTKTTLAIPYFNGDTPDTPEIEYRWTGTPWSSTSEKVQKAIVGTPDTLVSDDDNPAKTIIAISAFDRIRDLSGFPEARGVAQIEHLPYILEGKGVPFIVNGSSDQLTTADVVYLNENASVLDDIAVARDCDLAFAHVDRNNVLIVNDSAHMATTPLGKLDETDYTDIDVDFNTDACINSVEIVFLRATGGETTEIHYGPYVNQDSIDEWGVHHEEFKIGGLTEIEADIAAYAQTILDANSIPQVQVHSVTFNILNDEDIARHKAVVDLYDPVQVKYLHSNYDETLRVTAIEHRFSLELWQTTLGFAVDGSVATPQLIPSPPQRTGVADIGKGDIFFGPANSIPSNAFLCDGRSFAIVGGVPVDEGVRDLFNVIGYTYGGVVGSSFTIPDARSRMLVGAGALHALGGNEGALNDDGTRTGRWNHSHSHTLPGHSHAIPGQPAGTPVTAATGTAVNLTTRGSFDGHAHGGQTNTVSGSPNPQTPDSALADGSAFHPYLSVNYIIYFR